MFPAIFAISGFTPQIMEVGDVDLTNAIAQLTAIGVLPVITVVAVIGLASYVYRRFAK